MCGIAGIIDFKGKMILKSEIEAMCSVMTHRGPDAFGIYLNRNVGLGHRRLSIIDLSESANQPMPNEDRSIWLVSNGEIYNFLELREELSRKHHRFKSKSDSEVVIHGYEEWGEGIFSRLDGMFALVILDEKNRKIFLAKDRFGKKPLFYYHTGSRLIFASDIKAILKAMSSTPGISVEAIDCYLRYLYVPEMHSIFEGVEKVPAGCFVEFDFNGNMKGHQYWNISYLETLDIGKENNYIEIIDEKLKQAVRKRLISDVPLGVLLSGGVDSSLITAIVALMSGGKVNSFSVVFTDKKYDERKYSRMVAKQFSTDHTELEVRVEDIIEILPKLVWHYGEPFADSSAIPSYFIFRELKKHITVVLTGDGGDEIFGGYLGVRAFYFLNLYRLLIPHFVRDKIIYRMLGKMNEHFELIWKGDKIRHLIKFAHYGSVEPEEAYRLSKCSGWLGYRNKLYTDKFLDRLNRKQHDPNHLYEALFTQAEGKSDIEKLLYSDIKSRLASDFLVKIDVASMANSVEARSPFLDAELAEFVAQIPVSMLVKRGVQKYLLKKLASKYLPNDLIYRKKMGFSIPIEKWTREDLKDLIKNVLIGGTLIKRGFLNEDYVKYVLNKHNSGEEDHSHRIWSLLWLELWFRMFIDKDIDINTSLKDLG